MGQIAEAQAAVDAVRAEIEQIRALIRERRQELASLGEMDVDAEVRRDALLRVIRRLEDQLPRLNLQPSDPRRELELRLEQAEQHLEDLKRRRDAIVGRIAGAEKLAGILTPERLARVDAGLGEMEAILRNLGYHASEQIYGRVLAVKNWLRGQRTDVESLAELRGHLALLEGEHEPET